MSCGVWETQTVSHEEYSTYLWVVSQIYLSGDVVHGTNPLRREGKKHYQAGGCVIVEVQQ